MFLFLFIFSPFLGFLGCGARPGSEERNITSISPKHSCSTIYAFIHPVFNFPILPSYMAQTCPCPCGTWPAVLPVFIQMCQCPCVSLPAMPTPNLGSPPFSSPLNSGFYPSNPFSTPTTTAAPVVIHIAHADVIHIGARQDVNHTTETEEMSGKNVSSANASHRADDCRGSSSRFILLAEDKNVKVEYDTYRSYSSDQQLAANFVFTNKRSDASLKNISFEVVDSAGLFVDTSTGVVVPVKFPEVLPKSNWAMCIFFTLTTDTSSPQTVRGRVSYVVVDFAGNSRPEMNDFKMQFCS